MMSSEQTVASTGRRMKTSDSIVSGLPGGPFGDMHRGPIGDLLYTGDDQLVARFEAALDDVVVAAHRAEPDATLPRHRRALLVGLGDEREVLTVDAVHRHHR